MVKKLLLVGLLASALGGSAYAWTQAKSSHKSGCPFPCPAGCPFSK